MTAAKVKDGTGAGAKWRPDLTVLRCPCGGFLSKTRAAQGATRCLICERSKP